ncbi:MAG: ribosome small subunit-dependent GTPase A [Ndongobacter sp.]|nr:ribosome small subunit-dependent GTPase A [Ndongobacter sp.]
MPRGRIISSEKDRYIVRIEGELADVACRGRGVFRERSITPTVGDLVEVRLNGREGTILSVLPRRNLLFRPPVANIDQVLVVQTIVEPKVQPILFDKLLAVFESQRIPVLICFNKIDRVSEELLGIWERRYRLADYPVFSANALNGEGVSVLTDALYGKITAIAGPSGAGKSTLIRRLSGSDRAVSGALSEKNARGKQTTRRVELFQIGVSSYIFDTPGFSSLELRGFDKGLALRAAFREIHARQDACRFRDCTHRREPGCAVRAAVEAGEIDEQRYRSYRMLFEEIEAKRRY